MKRPREIEVDKATIFMAVAEMKGCQNLLTVDAALMLPLEEVLGPPLKWGAVKHL